MGRLSVTYPIQYNDLFDFSALSKGHPVWLVTGDCGSALVIKGDVMTESSTVDQALQIMNLMSPSGRTTQLTTAELGALVRYTSELRKLNAGEDPTLDEAILFFQSLAAKPMYKFTKMDVLKLTTLGSSNRELSDKNAIKLIAKAANAPGGLEDLGEIIGADMWNCNYDRFSFIDIDNPGTITVNGVKMNHLINLGNIMVHEMAGEYRFVGLDALDPTSNNLDFSKQYVINKWGFRWFDRRVPTFRENVQCIGDRCASDLKYALGKKSGLLKQYRLKSGGGARIAKGLMNAVVNIERHLKGMYGPALRNAPKSIRDRAEEVGWL